METPSARVTWRALGTLPNLLSLVRIPLGAAVWLAPGWTGWLLALMVAAAVSDLLDGWVARRAGLADEHLGAWLDPLCDKAFVLSVLVAVWVTRAPPAWTVLVTLTREAVLLPLVAARLTVPRLKTAEIPWRALVLGKATTVAQFAWFGAVVLDWTTGGPALAVMSGALGLGAGAQYAWRAWRVMQGQ